MEDILKAIGMIALVITSIFYQLFVFTKIWSYVAVPLGAPAIGLMTAWGIGLVIGIFVPHPDIKNKELAQALLNKMAVLTFSWGLAYWFFT